MVGRLPRNTDNWSSLDGIFSDTKSLSVLVIGDLMLDEYLYGAIDRISPEAPVGILNWSSQRFSLGGAANVGNNLAGLGCQVFLAGVVGQDHAAEEFLNLAKQSGMNTDGVVVEDRPTTLKTRVIGHGQQVLRIDKETRSELSHSAAARLVDFVLKSLPLVDGVVLSDYAKGIVSSRLAQRVIGLARQAGKPVVVDPKGIDYAKYRGATLVKPNIVEAKLVYPQEEGDSEASLLKLAGAVRDLLGGSALLLTRGAEGMSLFEHGAAPLHIPSVAQDVFDDVFGHVSAAAVRLLRPGDARHDQARRHADQ